MIYLLKSVSSQRNSFRILERVVDRLPPVFNIRARVLKFRFRLQMPRSFGFRFRLQKIDEFYENLWP